MTNSSFGYMELFRLSPSTGEILSKLNLFQGQILYGRVFRSEPVTQTDSSSQNSIDPANNFLLKIALGSNLIDALVSEPIPAGSRLTLEVIKLANESLVLKLLDVDSSGKPVQTGRQDISTPDSAELSPQALGTKLPQIPSPAQTTSTPLAENIVSSPSLAGLPRSAVQVIRAAIAEQFVDPVTFSARLPEAKASIQAVMDQLDTTVSKAASTAPDLAESVQTIIQISRSILKALPDSQPTVSEIPSQTSDTLINLSSILRPSSTPVQNSAVTSAQPDEINPAPSQIPQAVALPASQSAANNDRLSFANPSVVSETSTKPHRHPDRACRIDRQPSRSGRSNRPCKYAADRRSVG